jgi:2-polyprenyl-3-methyl-5-hydroxy-6-metoxy-1,4-benzoquinol methylase
MANLARRAGRALAWPVRRYFNPRFEAVRSDSNAMLGDINAVHHAVNQVKDMMRDELAASAEAARVTGSQLTDLIAAVEGLEEAVSANDYLRRMGRGRVEEVSTPLADVLNFSVAPTGFAAQRGLYFNPAVWIAYSEGDARIGGMNERILEGPYAFRALDGVPTGARVLDVGGAESTVCVSAASLGYQVTMIDPRPYPLSHPNLTVEQGFIEEWETDARFDAVLCISTIEHLGLGAYGLPKSPDADLHAMKRLWELSEPNALLVLTTPYGEPRVDDLERTYDKAGVERLVEGWSVEDMRFGFRTAEDTWELVDGDDGAGRPGVALVTARRAP